MAPEKHHRDGERGAAAILFVSLVVAAAIVAAGTMMIGVPQFWLQQGTGTGFDLTALRKAVEAHAMLNGENVVCPDADAADPEGRNAGGDAGADGETDGAIGACTEPMGPVPWKTIGVSQRQATDAWGRLVRLVVDNSGAKLDLISYKDGKRSNCDFILVSGGADSVVDTTVSNAQFDMRNANVDQDIAVCGKLAAADFGGGGGNKISFETTKKPTSPTSTRSVEAPFVGTDPALGEGTVVHSGYDPEGDGVYVAYPSGYTACMWSRPALPFTTQTVRAFFKLRFYPGETGTNIQGTGAGLTFTVVPGNADLADPTENAEENQGVVCGEAQHLGYAGGIAAIPLPKMAVEFDIYSDAGANDPDRNHVAVLTAWGDNVNDTVTHGGGENVDCDAAPDACLARSDTDAYAYTFLEERDMALAQDHPDLAAVLTDGQAGAEYPIRIEIARRFHDSTCTLTSGNGRWMRTKVWVNCTDEACDDSTDDYLGSEDEVLSYCHPDPGEQDVETGEAGNLSYDTVRFGFTFGSYGAGTGYILSDLEMTVSNASGGP